MRAQNKTTAAELYETLRKLQESKGYYFNRDHEIALEILRAMLELKESYGYLVCPCRLSSGERDKDRDILCPCVYREDDVREYDFCYCGLYTSQEAFDARKPRVPIPERRPVEKSLGELQPQI